MSGIAFIVNVQAGISNESWLDKNRSSVEAVAQGGPIVAVSNGDEIEAAVHKALALQCKAIVAAGGDGTINAVASHLVGSPTPLGVLPMGTLNHFAQDVGVPLDPELALQAIAAGHHVTVDVGEVNGQFFLNNSSLGLYPDIVRDRERQQRRLGRGKWVAFAWATWGAIRRYPFLTVKLDVDGRTMRLRTPFVFIGNNAYEMQGLRIGTRSSLSHGVLSVYATREASRWRLLMLALRAVFGRLRQTHEFRAFTAQELNIETHHRRLRVSTDGEVRKMDAPFQYRIHAGALRVIVPQAPEQASQAPS